MRISHLKGSVTVVAIGMLGIASLSIADYVPVGTATNAIGTLTIVRTDGVQQRLQGKRNVPLYEGDVLKTDGGSQALIEFQDGIQVALNESTTFKLLSRWERDKPTVRILRLKQGEVWAKTAGGPKRFEVETPIATAAAANPAADAMTCPSSPRLSQKRTTSSMAWARSGLS